jgi:hypothetical protein
VTVRYHRVEIPGPKQHSAKAPIQLSIIHLVEEAPPEDAEPIEWYLLTTMEITTPEQARRILQYYCFRWRIEDWHRVLKTGCRIEDLRNETAERLKRAIAVYLVIAWRIMLMTLLGRDAGANLPADLLFSDIEIEVLTAFANRRRDLKPPTNLREAVLLVGRLGGHLGRKNDLPPGHQTLWIGYSKLLDMCDGFELGKQARSSNPP